jgi:hypothetical protein
MTVRTQIRVLVVCSCLLPITSVARYLLEPRTQLSVPAMMGNFGASALMLYFAKKLHDKSKRDKSS